MFTVEDYLNSGGQTDFIEIAVGSETFCIRRLNGLERLRLQDIEKSSERIIYVIGICLLDGNTKMPIGQKNAEKFVARYDALSNEVASQIVKATMDSVHAEETAWGLAEKNLPETSGSADTGNTADATG